MFDSSVKKSFVTILVNPFSPSLQRMWWSLILKAAWGSNKIKRFVEEASIRKGM
jgi:hypothetical protein